MNCRQHALPAVAAGSDPAALLSQRIYYVGGADAVGNVLDGDARKQFDALWHFLQAIEGN